MVFSVGVWRSIDSGFMLTPDAVIGSYLKKETMIPSTNCKWCKVGNGGYINSYRSKKKASIRALNSEVISFVLRRNQSPLMPWQ